MSIGYKCNGRIYWIASYYSHSIPQQEMCVIVQHVLAGDYVLCTIGFLWMWFFIWSHSLSFFICLLIFVIMEVGGRTIINISDWIMTCVIYTKALCVLSSFFDKMPSIHRNMVRKGSTHRQCAVNESMPLNSIKMGFGGITDDKSFSIKSNDLLNWIVTQFNPIRFQLSQCIMHQVNNISMGLRWNIVFIFDCVPAWFISCISLIFPFFFFYVFCVCSISLLIVVA